MGSVLFGSSSRKCKVRLSYKLSLQLAFFCNCKTAVGNWNHTTQNNNYLFPTATMTDIAKCTPCYLPNKRSVQITSVHSNYRKFEIRVMERKNKILKIKEPPLLSSVLFRFGSFPISSVDRLGQSLSSEWCPAAVASGCCCCRCFHCRAVTSVTEAIKRSISDPTCRAVLLSGHCSPYVVQDLSAATV